MYTTTPAPTPAPRNESQLTPITKSLKQNWGKVLAFFFVATYFLLFSENKSFSSLPTTPPTAPVNARVKSSEDRQLREQYGMQDSDVENSGRQLCRDAVSAYYCSFIERCGRGSCIPPNKIRCDDKPDGSTYDCRKGQTCGKGRCVPLGKKLCDTDSHSRFCNGFCCQGTLPTNSQVSCFLGSSCPAGTVQVMEYQHPDYQYSGEET